MFCAISFPLATWLLFNIANFNLLQYLRIICAVMSLINSYMHTCGSVKNAILSNLTTKLSQQTVISDTASIHRLLCNIRFSQRWLLVPSIIENFVVSRKISRRLLSMPILNPGPNVGHVGFLDTASQSADQTKRSPVKAPKGSNHKNTGNTFSTSKLLLKFKMAKVSRNFLGTKLSLRDTKRNYRWRPTRRW